MAVGLTSSPSPFPLDLDEPGNRFLCVDLSEDDFRAASFLDERILNGRSTSTWATADQAAATASRLTGESDFIFHIGHVGSTLVSRLLGASDRVFALREPAVLRTLARRQARAKANWDPRLQTTLKLLARTWRPPQRSLVKATSFVSEIAPAILTASPTSKALLMFAPPQVHIATRLAGRASRAELPRVAGDWLIRLHERLGCVSWRLETLTEGEQAALGWTCEICALADVIRQFPGRTRWLEFEGFLGDPVAGLAFALEFLRRAPRGGEIAAIFGGGDLGRYSKAPEFDYDAATRRQVIEQGLRGHGAEIERGLAWINAAANAHPNIADALRSAAAAVRKR